MKNIMLGTLALILVSSVNVSAQSWKSLKNKVKEQTNRLSIPKELLSSGALSQAEVGRGLKEALNQGIEKGVNQLNKIDSSSDVYANFNASTEPEGDNNAAIYITRHL